MTNKSTNMKQVPLIIAYYIPQHPGPLMILLPSRTGVTLIFVFILSFIAPTCEITPIIFPSCRSPASVVSAVSRASSSRVPKPSSGKMESTLTFLPDILDNPRAMARLTIKSHDLRSLWLGCSLQPYSY